jgi:histone H3/H4
MIKQFVKTKLFMMKSLFVKTKKIHEQNNEKLYIKLINFEFIIIFMIVFFNSIINAILNKILREILILQRVTNLLMSRMLFQRIIKKILQKHELIKKKHLQDLRIQRNVLNALQKNCEDFLIKTFKSMF